MGWPLLTLMACALALRLPYVTGRSIWFDEAASWQTARLTVPQLLNALRVDTTLPPYYLMLKAWMVALGDSPLSLRLSSIVLGLLTVAGMYLFAVELYLASCGRRPAKKVAAALRDGKVRAPVGAGHAVSRGARAARRFAFLMAMAVALSPFQVNASIEARMYALGTAVTALSGWLLLRAARGGAEWRWWLGYGGLAGFALYIHPYELFSIGAQFVYLSGLIVSRWLNGEPRRARLLLRRVGASGVLAALVFLPAVRLLLVQHSV
ncbi:MAG: glycosyltransferase family 39 protein, partial [Pirellulales bacterium]